MFTFTPSTKAIAPGQYRLYPGEKRTKIVVCCPGCEGEHQLGKHHLVSAQGLVNPQIRCPFFGCGWTQPSILAGWKAEES